MMDTFDELLIKHQYKMCLHGKPPHVLAYQLVKSGAGYEHLLLDEIIEPLWAEDEDLLTYEDVTLLLSALATFIKSCKNYLLEFDRLSLEEGSFYKRDHKEIAFTYLPFSTLKPLDSKSKIEAWLGLLLKHGAYEDEAVMRVMHPLTIALASESFSIDNFANTIESVVGVAL